MKVDYRQILSWLQRHAIAILKWAYARWDTLILCFLSFCLVMGMQWYNFRYTSPAESAVRTHVVQEAQKYLGYMEADGTHKSIVDRYNSHLPRARGYEVTYEDSWCAVFASTVAMDSLMDSWIPLECSCEQQIILFDEAGNWTEKDWYLPKPGDFIYYDWNSKGNGDCVGWSDHVGIVVQTFGPVIKVIEGNKEDDVSYRYVFVNDPSIRGFGTPDYLAISKT